MNIKLHGFMYFLHENKMIDVNILLSEDESGCINRLKLQKYVYLAQTCLNNVLVMNIVYITMVHIHQN